MEQAECVNFVTRMKSFKLKRLFFGATSLIISSLMLLGCGQQIPPTGGPKDSLPPRLITAIPAYGAKNFKSDRIVLVFDEYISLDNPFEKLEYSPTPKVNPLAEGKLKTVTIKIKDTLEENTTYSIDFGSSIVDINEKNPLRNFYYTFSTGAYLDSAFITGQILIAETGKIDSTMIAVLHDKLDDSAVAKEKPRYYAKLKGDGSFIFRNLRPGKYNIFGIKDVDGGKKYDQSSELISFLDSAIEIGIDTAVTLYAFEGISETLPVTKPSKPKVAGEKKKEEDKRLKFGNALEAGKQDILSPLVLSSDHPLKDFDSNKIKLTDNEFKPVPGVKIEQDSTGKKLIINYAWPENTAFKLILEKDLATDTLDNKYIKTDTISFTSKKETDYGSIDIRIDDIDSSKHPVLLIVKENKIVFKQKIKLPRYQIKLFNPGEYQLRMLYDNNENGQWDTGDYWKKIQPEKVVSRKQPFLIKANWDNELRIASKDF